MCRDETRGEEKGGQHRKHHSDCFETDCCGQWCCNVTLKFITLQRSCASVNLFRPNKFSQCSCCEVIVTGETVFGLNVNVDLCRFPEKADCTTNTQKLNKRWSR